MSIVQPLYDKILEMVLEQDARPEMPNRQARRAVLRLLLENEDEHLDSVDGLLPDVMNSQSSS